MGKDSSLSRIVREKETFRTEQIIDLDGQDVRFYVKASVNYERMSYKVQPIITMIHGEDSAILDKAILDSIQSARLECETRLESYRQSAGIGAQGDLFAKSSASSDA